MKANVQFLTLTLFSIPLDIYVLLFDVSGISLLFSILILLLKAPVFVTCSIKLRERGGELGFGQGSWGFQGLPGSTGVGGSAGAFGRAEQGNSSESIFPLSLTTNEIPLERASARDESECCAERDRLEYARRIRPAANAFSTC